MESLYEHFLKFVDVKVEAQSGIAILRVRAFTPGDAQEFARSLLKGSEIFVNRLNTEVFRNALLQAESEVARNRESFETMEARLTAFRNEHNMLDPENEKTLGFRDLSALMSQLAVAEGAMSREMALAPKSPQLMSLSANIASLRDQIDKVRNRMSGAPASLASQLPEYESILLERELSSRALMAAEARRIKAQQDSEQQQYYLETIAAPNLPDEAHYPSRLTSIAVVALFSFCIFWIAQALLTNVYEHRE